MTTRRPQRALILGIVAVLPAGLGTGVASAFAGAQRTADSAPSVAVSAAARQPLSGATPIASQTPREPAPPASNALLTDERTSSTWAHPVEEVIIHQHPTAGSHAVARTHLATEDGVPEVYLLLSSITDANGRTWVRVRIPGRPNGRIGWVVRDALGEFHVTRWLVEITLGSRRLRAFYRGSLRFTAPVGIGKPSTPTPPGRFWIREIFKLASRSNPYWPYAIGTSDYSTLTDWPGGGVVGIHGDFGEPQAIPGDPSHGCVRMRDADLAWLATRVQIGTPVHIVR